MPIHSPEAQNTTPPEWSYNPSAWSQRVPLAALAGLGLLVALYLTSYQLHWLQRVWDPFFGSSSSESILTSSLAKSLPIPDALLGAGAYLVDLVGSLIGGNSRWKKAPWHVALFGVAAGPLGVASLFLVIAQPVLFHHWCTLCLVSAAVSTLLVGPAMDEVLASLQYLQRVKRSGQSVWRAFWGDSSIYSIVH